MCLVIGNSCSLELCQCKERSRTLHEVDPHSSPNIVALNFGTTLQQNIILIICFTAIAGVLMFFFYRVTLPSAQYTHYEAFQTPEKRHGWSIILMTLLLTVVYLPLSTVAVHIIVWSDELWVIANPYTNATTSPPVIAPLGPADQYRDPLDFCYTTTMRKDEINWAPLLVIMAMVLFVGVRDQLQSLKHRPADPQSS